MASWVIIAVLVLLVLMFFRVKRMQHKFYAILLILAILFFYVTASKVLAENNVDVKSFNGMVAAGKLYFNWLVHSLGNVKTLAGNAIKMDWQGNATIK